MTACNFHRRRHMISRIVSIALMVLPAFSQVDVLTQRNDNARSALNLHETILNHKSVRTKFGKLWSLFADAKIMAQPLYVSNMVVPAASLFGAAAKAKCPT